MYMEAMMKRISKNGLRILKEFEGCRLTAYKDLTGIPTIGYGFTKGVKMGDTMTQEQCDKRLTEELRDYENAVYVATLGDVSQNEADALICFAWNVGIAGMEKSSVIKAHNRGDKPAAARAFGLWNKAGEKVVPGLVRRRASEAALYLTPEPGAKSLDMPQEIDPPKPMANSSTVIAGGTAALATTSQILQQVETVKYSTDALQGWLTPLLAVVALLAIGYIIYERFRSRERGNA